MVDGESNGLLIIKMICQFISNIHKIKVHLILSISNLDVLFVWVWILSIHVCLGIIDPERKLNSAYSMYTYTYDNLNNLLLCGQDSHIANSNTIPPRLSSGISHWKKCQTYSLYCLSVNFSWGFSIFKHHSGRFFWVEKEMNP